MITGLDNTFANIGNKNNRPFNSMGEGGGNKIRSIIYLFIYKQMDNFH